MTPENYQVIHDYFKEKLGISVEKPSNDKATMTWRFLIPLGKGPSPMLALSEEVVEDLNEEQLRARFDGWKIAEVLSQNPGHIVLVTSNGPTIEPRS